MKVKHLLLSLLLIAGMASLAQVPEYWFLDELNPGMDITLAPDGEMVQEGTFSCKMVLHDVEVVPYLISDNYDVNPGDAYTFSIYYYDNDNRGSLRFYAEFYDADGIDIWGEDPVYSEDADEWQQVTWSSTVPDGAVEGYVWIKLYDDPDFVDEAVVWVDNASFVVNGENLVMNGSFESWPGVGIEVPKEESLTVFPNPATDKITVANVSQAERIEIRNMLGQLIFSTDVAGRESVAIDLTEYQKGIYFVSTIERDKSVTSTKINKL